MTTSSVKSYFCLVLLLLESVSSRAMVEPLEGDCTRFVYEYRLMQKLVKLEQENEHLKERLVKLEQRGKPISVAVKVRLSSNQDLAKHNRVLYDIVISNVGNAYDLEQGQFVAPVSGIYMISVQACLGQTNQWMDLDIIRDGAIIGRVFSGDHIYHSCGAEGISLHLDKGSKIWTVRVAGAATILNQDHGWNSFSAVLVQQDF